MSIATPQAPTPAPGLQSALPSPPGPRGLPLLGVAHELLRDPFAYPARLAREYGDVVSVPVPGMTLILVSHPDHVNHIMNRRADHYEQAWILREAITAPQFPPPHPVFEGEPHRRVRRVLNPKFSQKGLAGLSGLIGDEVAAQIDGWGGWADTGEVIDLEHELHLLSMAILLRSMFTAQTDRPTVAQIVEQFDTNTLGVAWRIMLGRAPGWLPRPYSRRSRAACEWVAAYLDRMVAERRRDPIDTPDLLNTLLAARFEDGSRLSDEQLRSELRILIIAGHETTATALSWTFALLGRHLAASRAAYDEVDTLDGKRLDNDDLSQLSWLRACFDEAQRVQGVALTLMARQATQDDEIGGYRIRKGAVVGYSGSGLFNDPRFWREPDRFDPSRFIDEEINKHAFPVFSLGAHRCLGMRLAYMEALFVLATAFQRYRFELAPGFEPKRRLHFGAARLAGGLPVTVHRR